MVASRSGNVTELQRHGVATSLSGKVTEMSVARCLNVRGSKRCVDCVANKRENSMYG